MATGFPVPGVIPVRPGRPVDGVLENPGNRVVIFRGNDKDGVGGANALLEQRNAFRRVGFFILIEGWNPLEVKNFEVHPLRDQLLSRP